MISAGRPCKDVSSLDADSELSSTPSAITWYLVEVDIQQRGGKYYSHGNSIHSEEIKFL